jgi:hypothetical protein
MKTILRALTFSLVLFPSFLKASANDTVIFTPLGHYYYSNWPWYAAYSPLLDRTGRSYIYAASVDLGMVTFDFSNTMNVHPIDTITTAELNNSKATFCAQQNMNLYIATGGFQSAGERAGLSIYDVTNPASPVLQDHWDSAAFTHGSSQVILSGNYAYLAAMDDGVIILNVANPANIQFVSQVVPSTISCLNANHARGLFISHDTLLVANDCGGLRVIDVTNKSNPVEIGAYQNSSYSGIPYYNHVWRLGDHAYIPVDYCGFEVDNVANPSAIVNEGMWNPIPCNSSNWNGADLHGNEIVSALPTANVLMVSGGDSQLLAFDPSNPSQPRLMGAWGPANTDTLGAWGVDVFGNYAVLGYIHTPFPFNSVHGGVQLLSWNLLLSTGNEQSLTQPLQLYPNPSNGLVNFSLPVSADDLFTVEVIDAFGRLVRNETVNPKTNGRQGTIDLTGFAPGVYTIRLTGDHIVQNAKLVKQ